MNRGFEHFTDGLSAVFQRMTTALKPNAPLAFTYHHNELEAYEPIAVAILDSGLSCTATLPCPAEMGASIHISGTGSSIIDTVFVCRKGAAYENPAKAESLSIVVRADLTKLIEGGVKPSLGDVRCIAYGHLVRIAITQLQKRWDKTHPTSERIDRVRAVLFRCSESFDIERLSAPFEDIAAQSPNLLLEF